MQTTTHGDSPVDDADLPNRLRDAAGRDSGTPRLRPLAVQLLPRRGALK
jgi:hypothetical protein